MGYYIETGDVVKGKEIVLVSKYGAEIIDLPESFDEVPEDKALICVVDNGLFEAAAHCYNESEFEAFKPTPTDQRPRQWLIMDKGLACQLSGYKGQDKEVV